MKTLVPFVERVIPKEYALLRAKLKLAAIVRMSMRPTRTTENFEKCVVRNFLKK
jgi:hypothetical protein